MCQVLELGRLKMKNKKELKPEMGGPIPYFKHQ